MTSTRSKLTKRQFVALMVKGWKHRPYTPESYIDIDSRAVCAVGAAALADGCERDGCAISSWGTARLGQHEFEIFAASDNAGHKAGAIAAVKALPSW